MSSKDSESTHQGVYSLDSVNNLLAYPLLALNGKLRPVVQLEPVSRSAEGFAFTHAVRETEGGEPIGTGAQSEETRK